MKIDLMAAFKDLLSTEEKWMNLLGVSVCNADSHRGSHGHVRILDQTLRKS